MAGWVTAAVAGLLFLLLRSACGGGGGGLMLRFAQETFALWIMSFQIELQSLKNSPSTVV